MQLPTYFEPRPSMDLDDGTVESFERLYRDAVEPGSGAEIAYSLDVPRWKFLCYLTDTRDVVMHGSGNPGIDEFEPRQSNDIAEFGNREAVYAASDGLWAMYFAVMDRDRYVTSLTNACFRVVQEDGSLTDPYYFFSINEDALPHQPWRDGTIYILPRATFEEQSPIIKDGMTAKIAQWASLVPVKPLARIAVRPSDFPFLSRVRGHNMEVLRERAMRDPKGFPWLDE